MTRIVLYDKHEISRAALKELIATNGFSIVEASKDDNILRTLQNTSPEVLIINLMYLQCASISQIKHIHQTFPKVSILAISAFKEKKNHTLRLMKAGISGFLTPEDGAEELFKAIKIVATGEKYVNPRMHYIMYDYLMQNKDTASHEHLSDREYEIFFYLAQGDTISDIACHLNISEKTVSTYKSRMMDKMKFDSIAELIKYAYENDLLNKS